MPFSQKVGGFDETLPSIKSKSVSVRIPPEAKIEAQLRLDERT
jgi:hypothetical protein